MSDDDFRCPDAAACRAADRCALLGRRLPSRFYDFCAGTSGLPRWQELAYLGRKHERPALPAGWPRWAERLKARKATGEKGVGDTLARLLARVGGEMFKRVYKRLTGGDCGCADRQQTLNQLYPYPPA